jgi:hypothetical protein
MSWWAIDALVFPNALGEGVAFLAKGLQASGRVNFIESLFDNVAER